MASTCVVRGRYPFSAVDAERTLFHLGLLWDLAVRGHPPGVLDDAEASVAGRSIAAALAAAAGEGSLDDEPLGAAIERLGAAAAAATKLPGGPADRLAGLLDATWGRLVDLHEDLRAAGGFTTQQGTLDQVSASSGGVPKVALDEGRIGWAGLTTDRQAVRRHHGRPWQALCLWSAEVIDELRAEGHPVAPGTAGENLTLRGIDWAGVRPGSRVRIADMACVVGNWADPCATIADSFADRDFRRVHAERGPVSRAYATVVAPGTVRPGDPVVVD